MASGRAVGDVDVVDIKTRKLNDQGDVLGVFNKAPFLAMKVLINFGDLKEMKYEALTAFERQVKYLKSQGKQVKGFGLDRLSGARTAIRISRVCDVIDPETDDLFSDEVAAVRSFS